VSLCTLFFTAFGAFKSLLAGCLVSKINESIKYKLLSLTYKSLKTGQPSYLRSLLSFPSHRCNRSSSLITLSRPSLTSRLKIANRSFSHSAPVLWNNFPSHLHQVVHHVTPSISNSLVSDLSNSLFLKKLKTHLFHSSFSFLVCIHLGNLRTDISGIDQASSFHLTRISLSFTVTSLTPIFMLFDL